MKLNRGIYTWGEQDSGIFDGDEEIIGKIFDIIWDNMYGNFVGKI